MLRWLSSDLFVHLSFSLPIFVLAVFRHRYAMIPHHCYHLSLSPIPLPPLTLFTSFVPLSFFDQFPYLS